MSWRLLLVLFCAVCTLEAAPVYEFNGDLWHPIPNRKLLEKSGEETVTLMANASTPMSEFRALFEGIMQSSAARQLKFQLRSQQRNALVTLGRGLGESGATEGATHFALIATGPGGTSLAHMDPTRDLPGASARLDANLEGIQSFLNAAGRIFAIPEGRGEEGVPTGMIVVRSNCSFGQFLNVVQLLKQSGCRKMTFEVNDFVPDPAPDILVDLDSKVEMPVAQQVEKDVDERGRIVLTIDDDAVPMDEDGVKLDSDVAVRAYLSRCRKEVEKLGVTPRLCLRTVESLHFSHVRHAIRLAARENIHEVVFVSLVLEQFQKQIQPEFEGRDFELELPAADPREQQPGMAPLMIKIDQEGTVLAIVGERLEKLDEAGEIERLDARLALYVGAARAGKAEPLVQIVVDGKADHERVIEVLNALARHEINAVTFVDPGRGGAE